VVEAATEWQPAPQPQAHQSKAAALELGTHRALGFRGPTSPLPQMRADDGDLARLTNRCWSTVFASNAPPWLYRCGGGPSWVEILVEENGSVWISTFNGLNLYRDGEIKQFFSNDGTLYHNSILNLFQASDGKLWAATYDDGVFVMDLTTSGRQIIRGPDFQVYPNPATDHLSLELNQPAHKLQMVNSSGNNILLKDINSSTRLMIEIADIPSGFYQLIVHYLDGKKAVERIVKIE
jgi:hypothetical protein